MNPRATHILLIILALTLLLVWSDGSPVNTVEDKHDTGPSPNRSFNILTPDIFEAMRQDVASHYAGFADLVAEAADSCDVAIYGKVLRASYDRGRDGPMRYEIKVLTQLGGAPISESDITVTAGGNWAIPFVELSIGDSYILFLRSNETAQPRHSLIPIIFHNESNEVKDRDARVQNYRIPTIGQFIEYVRSFFANAG